MKIRWTRGSIRFRITPSELAALREGREIVETLALPGGEGWRASVQPGSGQTDIREAGSDIRLSLTAADVERLAAPEMEGVYFRRGSNAEFRYYVEKDFPCVHPGAPEAQEARTETFAPPPGFKARHRACE